MTAVNSSEITSWIGLISREALSQNLELVGSPWVFASFCSALVGLSGLLPVFWLSREKTSENGLRFMLSFACGGLLGDVFLHLLPEAHERLKHSGEDLHTGHLKLGLWILLGGPGLHHHRNASQGRGGTRGRGQERRPHRGQRFTLTWSPTVWTTSRTAWRSAAPSWSTTRPGS